MGLESEKALEERDKRKQKNQTANPWADDTAISDEQSWDDVPDYLIAYVVKAVGGAGGSAQFTVTADQGALGIRIYHDDAKTKTSWWRIGSGLEEALQSAGDYYRLLMDKDPVKWP